MIIISEFSGNKEIGRKCFYFKVNDGKNKGLILPEFETEAEVENWYMHKNFSRFSVYKKVNTLYDYKEEK